MLLGFASLNFAQEFPWPVTPFDQPREVSGAFAEYRDTSVNGHFHNGTDIPKIDGSPVYPVKEGFVTSIGPTGSNAFVRVQDLAYVHIMPNPGLSIGDSVFASQTILGTILPGQGHVHFTNGFVGAEKNSSLPGSGLAPFVDECSPRIEFIRFFLNNSTAEFSGNKVSGLVDIMVKVKEEHGVPFSGICRRNNGAYKVGYKIFDEDTSNVIIDPPNSGIRFQFDTKPNDSFANTVYYKLLSTLSSHVYQVTNDVTRDNFWDTTILPNGNYIVMAFTEDSRGNSDTSYSAVTVTDIDFVPPAQPVFRFAQEIAGGLSLGWFGNMDTDLLGYRLYFSFDNSRWTLFANEDKLTASLVDTSLNQVLNSDIYFKLTAVDAAPTPNESIESDVYGLSNGAFSNKVLVVDGFDRTDGSWNLPNHFFSFTHGRAIVENNVSFDTVPNEAVTDGSVALNDYAAVFWILGDESSADETFSASEQVRVSEYLSNGGMLFVSGSEIAWDLDQNNGSSASTAADEEFLHNYLKVDYEADDSNDLSVDGVDGTIFEGLSFNYGVSPYPENFPDVINAFGEQVIVNLKYNSSQDAGIQFQGTFGNGTTPGKLVYLAFPFETISLEEDRNTVMARVLDFFFNVTSVELPATDDVLPSEFRLSQNYPNPFNASTTLQYNVPVRAEVAITLYNPQGQQVRTILNEKKEPGSYQIVWDGFDGGGRPVASGVYLLRMQARTSGHIIFQETMALSLVK